MGANVLRTVLTMDGGQFFSTLGRAANAASRFARTMRSIVNPFNIIAFTGALAGLTVVLNKVISASAEMESLQASFEVFFRSAEKAKNYMQGLARFAIKTPFELGESANAARILETTTRGALATAEGLRLVGDLAAGTQRPIKELALWVGRLYDGLMNGRPVGRAQLRLQELGIITARTRNEIEKLQAAGNKGYDVWDLAARDFMRFSGMMERMSSTWNVAVANFKDSMSFVFRAFGDPILEQLKPGLRQMQAALEKWLPIFGVMGKALSTWIPGIIEGMKTASKAMLAAFADPSAFVAVLKTGLEYAVWSMLDKLMKGMDNFYAQVEKVVNQLDQALADVFAGSESGLGKLMGILGPAVDLIFEEAAMNFSISLGAIFKTILKGLAATVFHVIDLINELVRKIPGLGGVPDVTGYTDKTDELFSAYDEHMRTKALAFEKKKAAVYAEAVSRVKEEFKFDLGDPDKFISDQKSRSRDDLYNAMKHLLRIGDARLKQLEGMYLRGGNGFGIDPNNPFYQSNMSARAKFKPGISAAVRRRDETHEEFLERARKRRTGLASTDPHQPRWDMAARGMRGWSDRRPSMDSGVSWSSGGLRALRGWGGSAAPDSWSTSPARVGGVRRRGETKEQFRDRMSGKMGDELKTTEEYLQELVGITEQAWGS